MKNLNFLTRVALVAIAVPTAILLFNLLGNALCEVWHYDAIRHFEKGGGIATAKLKAYWFTRHLFLFLGTVAGLVVSQAVYFLWQGKDGEK